MLMAAGKSEVPKTEERVTVLDEAFARDFLKRLRNFFNAHDPALFTELMAEDVMFDHLVAGSLRGRDEVSSAYTSGFWKAFPDVAIELAEGPFFHPLAPHMAFVWRATGTNTGPLYPAGLPATGRKMDGPIWEILEFRDGLISRISQAFDTAGMMRQLGVLPATGSRAERWMFALGRLRIKLSSRH